MHRHRDADLARCAPRCAGSRRRSCATMSAHCVEDAIASGNKSRSAAQDRRTDGRARPGGPGDGERTSARISCARAQARRDGRRSAIKRAYDEPSADDGLRILIDRLWPRGLSKSKLKLDAWVKHLSPSNELRKWYQHDPKKFAEFRKRYVAELKAQGEGLASARAVKGRPSRCSPRPRNSISATPPCCANC